MASMVQWFQMASIQMVFVALLGATIILHNSLPCESSSVFEWGDMDDFMKFINKYQTSSQIIHPSPDEQDIDQDQIGENILELVSKINNFFCVKLV